MDEIKQSQNCAFFRKSYLPTPKNIIPILVSAFLFLLYFMPYLASTSLGIDSHFAIEQPGSTFNWLEIGRQGAVLINKFFLQNQFSLFYAEAFACAFCLFSLIGFVWLFYQLADVSPWVTSLFFLLFMLHPIWTEQFYFVLQIVPVSFGLALLPVILFCAYSEKPLFWGIATAFMILLFSIYQTFAIVYVAGCVLCFLLYYIRQIVSGNFPSSLSLIKSGVRQVILFAAAYLVNALITKAFFSSSDYLTGQIMWGQEPFDTCLGNILTHIIQVVTGSGVFYTASYPLSLLALVAGVFLFFFRYRNATAKWIPLLAILFLQITPFLLTIYGGTIPAYRSQFILPFTTGCNFVLFLVMAGHSLEQKIWKMPFMGFCLFAIVLGLSRQYYTASLLQYSTALVQQNDRQLSERIQEKLIETTGGSTKPLAFIGCAPLPETGSFLEGEVAQKSLFGYEWYGDYPTGLSFRAVSYMNAQGASLRAIGVDEITEARGIAQTMPSFPAEGSIQEADSFIVIKLGADDSYAPKFMTPQVTRVEENATVSFNNGLRGCVNVCSTEENTLMITAWVLLPYHDSNYVLPTVHLLDVENNTLYTLNSGTLPTPDLCDLFPENTDYSHCGVMGKAPLEQLPQDLSSCKIILSVTTLDETLYFDPAVSVGDFTAG